MIFTGIVAPLLSGLAIFLFGMKIMELALHRLAGPYLQQALERFTQTPWRGMVSGTVTTALLQSSTAVTVIVIGFVNAGLLTFPRTLGIILGTNIGTCITVELISLNITHYALPALYVSFSSWLLTWLVPLQRFAVSNHKNDKVIIEHAMSNGAIHRVNGEGKDRILSNRIIRHEKNNQSDDNIKIANGHEAIDDDKGMANSLASKWLHGIRYSSLAFGGFACVLLGMEVMHAIVPVLQEKGLLTWFITQSQRSLLWGVLAGILLTAIIQSSTATIAITMGLATAQLLSVDLGIAIILGANIGTCTTAFMANIGGTRSGQLVAWSHMILNIGGAMLFFPFITAFQWFVGALTSTPSIQLAHAQTIYNIACSLLALPICYMRFIHNIRVK